MFFDYRAYIKNSFTKIIAKALDFSKRVCYNNLRCDIRRLYGGIAQLVRAHA